MTGLRPLQLSLLALLILCSQSCQDINCNNCDTYLNQKEVIVEYCFTCISGYKLNDQSVCTQDLGLIIGISLGAAAAIIAQLICYIFCKIKYSQINKKKTEISLEKIYMEENDVENQGTGEDPDKCESLKTQFKIYLKNKCGICESNKTSIKTQCGHYFDHECFKKGIMDTPNLCPKCEKRALSPIEMICIRCLNKKRSIPLESITNYEYFREYLCITCKLKAKKEEQAKKWWKRCC